MNETCDSIPLSENIAKWKRPYSTGLLTEDEYEKFFRDGFVIKQNLLTNEQLESVKKGINDLVDIIADDLFQAGKIKDLHKDKGFYQRLTAIDQQFPGATILLHKRGILPKEIIQLWSCPSLLNIAKQLLGPNVAGHPVWNLRGKVPNQEQVTVPWHQDTAYLDKECWQVLQVTAWIPLLDANEQNGCLQVLRGGHRLGLTMDHNCCAGGTWYVELPSQEIETKLNVKLSEKSVETCHVPYGSVLLFNNLIPHRSMENVTNDIRWSLDLRWQRPDEPNGFYGLKDNIVMTKENDENFEADWDQWARINRSKLQDAAVKDDVLNEIKQYKNEEDERFDTTIAGPWMHNWPLVHHNRHTATLKANLTSWHSS